MINFFSKFVKDKKIDTVEESNKKMDNIDESNIPSINISQNGGIFEFEIKGNSIFIVKLEGNPTTGFSWFLKNVEEIKDSGVIEPLNIDDNNRCNNYISKPTKGPVCGSGGTFVFKFKVNNIEGKVLPKLIFIYKRPWEQNDFDCTSEISLKLNQDSSNENNNNNNANNEITLPQSATQGEIKIKDEIFSIKVKGNPTTGYSWFLVNEEELTNAGIVPLNLTEHKGGSYLSQNPKGMVGGGGIFDFQFKVTKLNNELPRIILTYRRPWLPVNENDKKLEITLI